MAASKRKIGIYTITGVVIASIIIATFLVSGLSPLNNPVNGNAMGTLSISVKDAPVELQKLDLTITSIYVQGGQTGSWIELNLLNSQPVSFDLLSLKDLSEEISQTQLSTGNYNTIRMEVSSALATFPDGTTKQLNVPSGHIDITVQFTISQNQETKLLIDIQPNAGAISSSGNFRPVITAVVTSAGATPTPSPSPTPVS